GAREGHDVGRLLAELDLTLSESLHRWANDLSRGAVDPGEAEPAWRSPREPPPGPAVLEAFAALGGTGGAARALRPVAPPYERLRSALERYRKIVARGGWSPLRSGASLRPGDRDERIGRLRRRLAAEGDPLEAPLARG